jgi:hypothetical protein
MSTFCLIHSSGQGPEGWKLLVKELEGRGHRTLTPALDLSRTDEGLVYHANTIVEALEQSGLQSSEIVCVAHSASGMYLPLVAERWRPRRKVFLAAVIPRPGMSIRDQLRADSSMFNPAWIGKNSMEDEVALEFVFHDCPPSRLEWALSTRIYFYAKRAMEEPCPLTVWPPVPTSYIVARKTGRSRRPGNASPLVSCSGWSPLNCPEGTHQMSAGPRF